jgi:hypothetical protein
MQRRPFPEIQRDNPFRRPTWRWDRANDLVDSGRYYSRRRDDTATGIAVGYLRDLARCRSARRLERVLDRYQHLHRARQVWEHSGGERLEIETRILARESDVAIAFEMDLPPSTIQAYRDVFFHVDDRIEATHYILFQVVGLQPATPPPARLLMQASAYMRGPLVIEPWLRFLAGETGADDLTTDAGRLRAEIELHVAVNALPETPETSQKLAELTPMLAESILTHHHERPGTALAGEVVPTRSFAC